MVDRATANTKAQGHLTKSRYVAGLQCPKRLWLTCYDPQLGTPAGPAKQALFDTGTEVGRAAWELFPGGIPVAERA